MQLIGTATALVGSKRNSPTIRDIQEAICRAWSISRTELLAERRTESVVLPRHCAFVLCKLLTTHSLPAIGRGFRGRDHTTVLHGVRKLEWLRARLAGEGYADKTILQLAARTKELFEITPKDQRYGSHSNNKA